MHEIKGYILLHSLQIIFKIILLEGFQEACFYNLACFLLCYDAFQIILTLFIPFVIQLTCLSMIVAVRYKLVGQT